jgi:oligoribonuclease (3'-5' exoribonuclease)
MPDLSNIYLWFDAEFTSLKLEKARLLQIAMVATNARLERVSPSTPDFNCAIRLEPDTDCDPWVRDNLQDLLTTCRSDQAVPLDTADHQLAAYIDTVVGLVPDDEGSRPVLAGNSVHNDWYLARKYLPALVSRINYRLLDVSGWKLVYRSLNGSDPFDKDDPEIVKQHCPVDFNSSYSHHDAHFDILASLAELNFYLQRVRPHLQP